MLLITFQHADCRQVTSDLIDLVRSCVMDPAFPALVEQVECALKKLTTDEPSIQQIWEQKPQKNSVLVAWEIKIIKSVGLKQALLFCVL